MDESLRVGIIGLGWGSLVHVPAFRSAAGYELVALCGQDSVRLQASGERFGISDLSTDWEAFVKRPDLDVVSIATPVEMHRPMVEAALAAGKHLVCEKPAGLDAREVEEMHCLAARSDTRHAVAFELRWLPEHLALAEVAGSGQLGRPVLVQLTRNIRMWHPSAAAVPRWKLSLDRGGGFLNAVTAHDVDLVCRLFGAPVAVCADLRASLRRNFATSADYAAADAEDTVALLLRLRSDTVVSISGTASSVHGSGYRLEVTGSEGSVELADGRLHFGRVGEGRPSEMPIERRYPSRSLAVQPGYPLFEQVRAMALLLEEWLRAFRGETSSAPTFGDALQVQRVIDAARASAAGAGWVDVIARR